MEKDILLKTSVMGFDKKSVMDFIEKLQIENEELKRHNSILIRENDELRDTVEKLQALQVPYSHEKYEETFMTYEDLNVESCDIEGYTGEYPEFEAYPNPATSVEEPVDIIEFIPEEKSESDDDLEDIPYTIENLSTDELMAQVDEQVKEQQINNIVYEYASHYGEVPEIIEVSTKKTPIAETPIAETPIEADAARKKVVVKKAAVRVARK